MACKFAKILSIAILAVTCKPAQQSASTNPSASKSPKPATNSQVQQQRHPSEKEQPNWVPTRKPSYAEKEDKREEDGDEVETIDEVTPAEREEETAVEKKIVAEPEKKVVKFGVDGQIYRIGDGPLKVRPGWNDTCGILELEMRQVGGPRYIFEFALAEAGTDVVIAVNKMCGIDIQNNGIQVIGPGNQSLHAQMLGRQNNNQVYRIPLSGLPAGRYAVIVESLPIAQGFQTPEGHVALPGERDDFLVGSIRIESTKAISVVGEGAR